MRKDNLEYKHTNHLINEASPYLQQHAHNPVNWYPWGREAFQKAAEEDKPLLISIGYSACHWCHVMERESFEDEEAASLMNKYFVCIKVDREERPDIDIIYMHAIQLLGKSGGWPLNCFALPDGKPFHAVTYLPKDQWMRLLQTVINEYDGNRKEVTAFARKLTHGIQTSEIIPKEESIKTLQKATLQEMLKRWSPDFDDQFGGLKFSPKFPMPNNYLFLLRYAFLTKDEKLKSFVCLTLDRMAYGGIFDQIGGGFSRYATDRMWKVPHFEKMLYDNAQLVSLYSEAYTATGKKLYKQVVYKTLAFIQREMTASSGAFCSGMDADSDGEEGKYYLWTKAELQSVLKDDFPLLSHYYNVHEKGFVGNGKYILFRSQHEDIIAEEHGISTKALNETIDRANALLLHYRGQRIHPRLDDKEITSWNALMIKGYADAFIAFGNQSFLKIAIQNADNILHTKRMKDGGLLHSAREAVPGPNGYLEDYVFCAQAFIALFQCTFDSRWLDAAQQLTDYAITHFFDEHSGMFWFTSDLDSGLIARKQAIADHVMPSSNSVMADNLFLLGLYYDRKDYLDKSRQMLHNVAAFFPTYPPAYSNWAILFLRQTFAFYEIAFLGGKAHELMKKFNTYYIPNKLITGSSVASALPLLENKFSNDQTRIYVCLNKACKMPVTEVEAAIAQIRDL